jgi:hypothetical protein
MAETFQDRVRRNVGFIRFLVFVAALSAQIVFFGLLLTPFPELTIVFYFPPLFLFVLTVMGFIAFLPARQVMKKPPSQKDHVA